MSPEVVQGLTVLAVLVGVYMAPTGVALLRGHRQWPAIAVLNVLLGWTVLGWCAALVWSVLRENKSLDRPFDTR